MKLLTCLSKSSNLFERYWSCWSQIDIFVWPIYNQNRSLNFCPQPSPRVNNMFITTYLTIEKQIFPISNVVCFWCNSKYLQTFIWNLIKYSTELSTEHSHYLDFRHPCFSFRCMCTRAQNKARRAIIVIWTELFFHNKSMLHSATPCCTWYTQERGARKKD